jgi:hypothetical protein
LSSSIESESLLAFSQKLATGPYPPTHIQDLQVDLFLSGLPSEIVYALLSSQLMFYFCWLAAKLLVAQKEFLTTELGGLKILFIIPHRIILLL